MVIVYYLWISLPIITGYSAKNLCSCYFVSNRPIESIKKEELGFSPVSFASLKVNDADSSVTSTVLGLAKQKAMYRSGAGCTLINGTEEKVLRSQSFPPVQFRFTDSIIQNDDLRADTSLSNIKEKILVAVNKSFEEPDAEKPVRTRAVVVLYDGKLLVEKYATGIDRNTRLMGWSMTKSVTSALVGLLVDAGKLEVEAAAPVPEWSDSKDPRRSILLKHLLQQTSGLKFTEDYGSASEATTMLFKKGDMAKYTASLPLVNTPGTVFYYSSGNTNILSRIIRQTVGEQEYHRFPYTNLFNKIGMYSAVIEPDASGSFVGSSYMYATARDWARFGLLYYNRGIARNQRILSEKWITESIGRGPSKTNIQYGYQFWLNAGMPDDPSQRRYPDVPADMFYADGYEGQNIFIIPSKKLVVVRLALTQGNHFDENNFLKEIIASLPPE